MNARPIYDSEDYIEVKYRGNVYPFKFTMKLLKKFQERYQGDREEGSLDELSWQIAAMFDAAVKVADYYGLEKLPPVTADELEETLDVSQLKALHGCVRQAIKKMNDKIAAEQEGDEWAQEELRQLGELPKPTEEEKN